MVEQKRPIAYVGITGFKDTNTVRMATETYLQNGFLGREVNTPGSAHEEFLPKHHRPMYGFLVSHKRLGDHLSEGKQSPRISDLGHLMKYTPRGALSMVHYFTPRRDRLAEEVAQVFSIGELYARGDCRALQINMEWPDITQIESIRQEHPEMEIVLQIPKDALGESHRAHEYGELVQYCLIDPSGGLGQKISREHLDLALELHESMPTTRIGVAGGLSGENIETVMGHVYSAINEPFCVDAQGRLRGEWVDGVRLRKGIDRDKVAHYVGAALKGIEAGEQTIPQ